MTTATSPSKSIVRISSSFELTVWNRKAYFVLSWTVAPEIEIKSKYDNYLNEFSLNCTINAYPLTNKYFWRKDGRFLNENAKHTISNLIVNEYTIVSLLKIKVGYRCEVPGHFGLSYKTLLLQELWGKRQRFIWMHSRKRYARIESDFQFGW